MKKILDKYGIDKVVKLLEICLYTCVIAVVIGGGFLVVSIMLNMHV